METKRTILSADAAQKKLRRMALEVVEQNYTSSELVLIGIRKSGSVIARRISAYLQEAFKGSVTVLELTMDKKNPG
ncbi:MAG TPA: phosphoribosyltransferase, partial [Ferruginibacter sp.]|nr:phosphoribosyltransferase [Ferruginibacter sp.]